MQKHVPPATHFTHLDLLTGVEARVPLGYFGDRQADLFKVMLASQQQGNVAVPYAERLLLEVDFSHAGWGVAVVGLAARLDMSPIIPAGTKLFFGSCAASPIYSEEIFNSVGRYYLNAMLQNPKANMPSLPGAPETFPWVSTFMYPEAVAQGDEFCARLTENIRALMASALNHCRMALASNDAPSPTPEAEEERSDDFGAGGWTPESG